LKISSQTYVTSSVKITMNVAFVWKLKKKLAFISDLSLPASKFIAGVGTNFG